MVRPAVLETVDSRDGGGDGEPSRELSGGPTPARVDSEFLAGRGRVFSSSVPLWCPPPLPADDGF